MIDPDKFASIQSGRAFIRHAVTSDLTLMSEAELVKLRGEIDRLLPSALEDLNLERELIHQYARVKGLQDDVLEDESVPPNQRAQVANAVAQTLQQLVRMQTDWNTSERLKEIESRLIRALNTTVPTEYVEAFFQWYEDKSK